MTAPDLDLSPRTGPPTAGGGSRSTGSRWPVFAVVAVLLAGGAFLVSQALSNATLFFLEVDEAVDQRPDMGTERFRMMGSVVPDTVERTSDGVTFVITYDGETAEVRHQGDPPELFSDKIPVVLEGHWEGVVFASDRMLVKHDEQYVEDNGDRIDAADIEAQKSAASVNDSDK